MLTSQIKAETENIQTTTLKLSLEVKLVAVGTLEPSKADSLKVKLESFRNRLNVSYTEPGHAVLACDGGQ